MNTPDTRCGHSPRGEDGTPPPAVVLCGQLEVSEGYGDAGSHRDEDHKDNEEYPVECVRLSPPDSGKDIVQFN